MDTQTQLPFDASTIEGTYNLGKLQNTKLFRAYTNDVYELDFESGKYILKVYGLKWRNSDEVEWELDLLDHLSERGVPLANAVKDKNGKKLGQIDVSGQVRPFVVFDYAAGAKPKPPFSKEHYKRFGVACAKMHLAGEGFKSEHSKPDLDLAYLIDQPLAVAKPYLKAEDWNFITELAVRIKAGITALSVDMDWGVCHGDMTQDNVHLTDDNEFVFYDFDSSGFGWRSLDFQGMYQFQKDADNGIWDAFLEGYTPLKPLSQVDLDAIPYFVAADVIWGLGIDLTQRFPAPSEEADNVVQTVLEGLRGWSV
jgi:Ser/Thr protein kinase RdoA (MazF antagonist)